MTFQSDSRRSTNIARLYNAIDRVDSRTSVRIEQIKLYIDGVGTGEEVVRGLVDVSQSLLPLGRSRMIKADSRK